MWERMTLSEKIKEITANLIFALFITALIFACSLSDSLDQTLIEARQTQGKDLNNE